VAVRLTAALGAGLRTADPGSLRVRAGDQVAAGAELGSLDAVEAGFAYPPHLHFELWSLCAETERNGYDRAGNEFGTALDNPIVDPAVLWRGLKLVPDSAPPPYRSEVVGVPELSLPQHVTDALGRNRPGWAIPPWLERGEHRICVRELHTDRPAPAGRTSSRATSMATGGPTMPCRSVGRGRTAACSRSWRFSATEASTSWQTSSSLRRTARPAS
jgi:hypothetical protein